MTAPWWTAADESELALLLDAVVTGFFEHRARCREPRCSHVSAAIEAVLDWRRARHLRSRAAWLRELQDDLEARRRAA